VKYRIILFAAVCFALTHTPTGATVVAANKGWFTEFGEHQPGNFNTLTGSTGIPGAPSTDTLYRSFFVFDFTDVVDTVTNAILRLELVEYVTPEPTETYTVFDVLASADTLAQPYALSDAMGHNIYTDLGEGVAYGGGVVSSPNVGSVQNIVLNTSAVLDINASLEAQFSVGIALPLELASGMRYIKFSELFGGATAEL
jgi:hypothetical protein